MSTVRGGAPLDGLFGLRRDLAEGLSGLRDAMVAALGPIVVNLVLAADQVRRAEPVILADPGGETVPDLSDLAEAALQGRDVHVPGAMALPLIRADGGILGALVVAGAGVGSPDAVRGYVPLATRLLDGALTNLRAAAALRLLRERNRDLQAKANTDHLTGLRNALCFEKRTEGRLRSRKVRQALIIVDLDGFKRINDVFGHQFGNRYLRCVADALARTVPGDTVLGRIGGDEFAICVTLREDGPQEVRDLMSRCRNAVMQNASLFGKPGLGRVSMGASLFPDHGEDYATLFELADAALYASKRLRRGTSTVFDPAIHQRFDSQAVMGSFDRALEEGRIVPWFQPIIDLRTRETTHLEVLARWIDTQGAVHSPLDFQAVLTDYRMAERLTRQVLGRALEMRGAGEMPEGVALSVNLTPMDLANPEFVFDFCAMLRAHGQTWEGLVFEVTENTVLASERDQSFRTLTELRQRGAKVALDDFGTGFGALSHLAVWPIDILKIDRHFVDGLDANPRSRAIIRMILQMAGELGYEVIAEGIESEAQRDVLLELGCRMGQGYLFQQPDAVAKPVPQGCILPLPAEAPRRNLAARS